MNFSVVFPVYMPIATFFFGKGYTLSYGDFFSVFIRFVFSSYLVTICDVTLESTINVSLSCFWIEIFQ